MWFYVGRTYCSFGYSGNFGSAADTCVDGVYRQGEEETGCCGDKDDP